MYMYVNVTLYVHVCMFETDLESQLYVFSEFILLYS